MLDPSGGVVDNYARLTNRATCTVQIYPLKGLKILVLALQQNAPPPNLYCQLWKHSLQNERRYGKPPLNLPL
jgi:hypothetical protein